MQHNASTTKTAREKAHLLDVVRFAQGRGPVTDISRQRDLILFRIARGNGQPVPLPEIQRGEWGKFVSDPQARICELRKHFHISCETHTVQGERHSTYLLELNSDKTPKMKQPYFAEQGKKPVTTAKGWKSEGFIYGRPQAPVQSGLSAASLDWETGRRTR